MASNIKDMFNKEDVKAAESYLASKGHAGVDLKSIAAGLNSEQDAIKVMSLLTNDMSYETAYRDRANIEKIIGPLKDMADAILKQTQQIAGSAMVPNVSEQVAAEPASPPPANVEVSPNTNQSSVDGNQNQPKPTQIKTGSPGPNAKNGALNAKIDKMNGQFEIIGNWVNSLKSILNPQKIDDASMILSNIIIANKDDPQIDAYMHKLQQIGATKGEEGLSLVQQFAGGGETGEGELQSQSPVQKESIDILKAMLRETKSFKEHAYLTEQIKILEEQWYNPVTWVKGLAAKDYNTYKSPLIPGVVQKGAMVADEYLDPLFEKIKDMGLVEIIKKAWMGLWILGIVVVLNKILSVFPKGFEKIITQFIFPIRASSGFIIGQGGRSSGTREAGEILEKYIHGAIDIIRNMLKQIGDTISGVLPGVGRLLGGGRRGGR